MWLGLTMGCFAGCKIILALCIGKILFYVERINGAFFGALLDVIYLVGFGALDYIDDPNMIIAWAFILSALGGVGQGLNGACTLAVESAYEEKRQKYLMFNMLV